MPNDNLPDDSVLSRTDYLKMDVTLENPIRGEIVNYLCKHGSTVADDLTTDLNLAITALHDPLGTLVNVGLVERRQRTDELNLKSLLLLG